MDFLLGALIAAAFFLLLIAAYQLGQKAPKVERQVVEDFELEEQREKARRLKKGFDEMMAYNETKARKG